MSVLVSNRTLSRTEYAFKFVQLYDYSIQKLSHVPKRKQRWLCETIIEILNKTEYEIMQISDQYFNYGIKLKDRASQAEEVIRDLLALQKPLLALWNIENYETKKMVHWCSLIDDEIKLIIRMSGLPAVNGKFMFILDYDAINKAEYVSNMCKLHKTIYGKAINLPNSVRVSKGYKLMSLADEALFCVCLASLNYPTDAETLKFRTEQLSTALNCVKQMQLPFFAIYNVMHYSEETMKEISEMLSTEFKLLNGVLKSDKQRFADLT